ncbi:MAG: ABC transporter substrate-binding protein [Acidimicrobiales bacterium]
MSEPLVLRTVTRTQGANRALKDSEVRVHGTELRFEEVPVLVQAFRRMVRGLEFDVCEMAVTTYLCAKAAGVAFTAIPVMLVRGLHHGATQVAAGSGVSSPGDLEGRRVGVNRGYTVTTGVWGRGILKDRYGVDLERVTWVRSGDEHVLGYQPPTNVVDLGSGESLQERLVEGDLAAVVGADIDDPRVISLIPDPERAAIDDIKAGGVYPVNHLVVIKDEVLRANPGVAPAIFEAFVEAKKPYLQHLATCEADTLTGLDRTNRLVWDATGSDPIPYGVEPNREVLEKLLSYAVDQKILASRVDLEDIFETSTLALSG